MVIKQWPDSIRVLHLFNQIFLKSFAPCIWISAWYLMPPHFCFQALETEWDKPCFSWVLLKGLWLWSWCQFAPVGWFQFFQRRMSNRLVKKHVLIWGISLCSWKFVGRNNYSSQQCIYIYAYIFIYIYICTPWNTFPDPHTIHGAGVFTYMNGGFVWKKRWVNIPVVPWILWAMFFFHHNVFLISKASTKVHQRSCFVMP